MFIPPVAASLDRTRRSLSAACRWAFAGPALLALALFPGSALRAATPAAAGAGAGGVLTSQRGIQIQVTGRPLFDVIQQLARATGTVLHVAAGASDSPSRLTLHWQGHSRLDAWSQVLANGSNYALQCDARACQLWLLGTPGAAGGLAADASPPPAVPRQADPAGLFPADG